MTHYDHLIIGGGMAADAAAHGIREQDPTASIGILGEEPTSPFPRPALSKKLWTDPDFTVENTALDTVGETGATFHPRTRVVAVDPEAHEVTTHGGDTVGYGRLLVATGGHPRTLTDLPGGDRVLYYRSLTDYHRLRVLADTRPHVAVVGGGYIGTEIAAALIGQGCRVTLLHPGDVLGAQMFPAELADGFERLFTDAGVEVRGGAKVSGGREGAGGVRLELESGDTVQADVVVVGLGVEPATHFLPEEVELADDGGVVVDEHLRTSAPDVYAAGDVASYPDPILGRTRVEHVDNATTMGTAAGRIMAGSEETYDHTPMFYSDVLGLGYQAVGSLDSSLETFVERVGEGAVAYYLDDEAVRGVLLWDLDEGVEEARALLARHSRPTDPADLAGTITG
ncbi:MAG: NAD(P)/FAD-dependent oxidoreductase [Actinobacteria bacterium]|nr:NAD(P)/FAD-dependent oxidoreductase [Actinomycetota bacterium]